jgi:hypothetical protein
MWCHDSIQGLYDYHDNDVYSDENEPPSHQQEAKEDQQVNVIF